MTENTLWQKVASWIDARGRREGWLAFILMRLSGVGLAVYLFLHLAALSILARGPAAWDAFIALAHSPVVLVLDGILIFGLLFHGLNGLRVGLLGLGVGGRYQARFFWGAFAFTSVLTGVAMKLILGIG